MPSWFDYALWFVAGIVWTDVLRTIGYRVRRRRSRRDVDGYAIERRFTWDDGRPVVPGMKLYSVTFPGEGIAFPVYVPEAFERYLVEGARGGR